MSLSFKAEKKGKKAKKQKKKRENDLQRERVINVFFNPIYMIYSDTNGLKTFSFQT